MILTPQEAMALLRLKEDPNDYPEINIILPAVDSFIESATGKDWGQDNIVDPVAKMAAGILFVRWFDNIGMIGQKVDDIGFIGLITQLEAKALCEG